jgi:RNase H-fold protein (predicted Holliday junction resolvase)
MTNPETGIFHPFIRYIFYIILRYAGDVLVEDIIVSLDPGKDKCGLAVVSKSLEVSYKKVVSTASIADEMKEIIATYHPQKILIGSGTFSKKVREMIRNVRSEIPLEVIDERHSTEQARGRFFDENPPRGIWKLVPRTMQVPREAYDDYAAIVLAEKYFLKCEKE